MSKTVVSEHAETHERTSGRRHTPAKKFERCEFCKQLRSDVINLAQFVDGADPDAPCLCLPCRKRWAPACFMSPCD